MSFLNDRDRFDKLASMILEVYKREHNLNGANDE